MALSGSVPSVNGISRYWLEIIPGASGNVATATVRLWSSDSKGGYGYPSGSAFPLKILINGQTRVDINKPIVSRDEWHASSPGDGRKSYADLGYADLATGGGEIQVYAEYTNNYSKNDWAIQKGTKLTVSDKAYPEAPGNPTVSTSVSNLERTSATINGSIDSWGNYSAAGNYSLTFNGVSAQETSRNLTGLTPNTNYSFNFSATNNWGKSANSTKSFTTTGNNPTITIESISVDGTTCQFNNVEFHFDYTTEKSHSLRYRKHGDSDWNDASSNKITGLIPNTTYDYIYTVTDMKDRSGSISDTFTTTYTIEPIGSGSGNSKIEAKSGGFNCIIRLNPAIVTAITEYYLDYKIYGSQDDFTRTPPSSTNIISKDNLSLDTVYECRLVVKNSAGDISVTNSIVIATWTQKPIINSIIDLIDGITLGVTVNAEPSGITQNLKYSFSIDDGVNWTTPSDSNSYTWSGLEELTTYPIKIRVIPIHRNQEYGEDKPVNEISHPLTTDVDQAKIRIKTGGNWIEGKTYIKQNNQWVKAKRIYIKKNNQWVIGKNQ